MATNMIRINTRSGPDKSTGDHERITARFGWA